LFGGCKQVRRAATRYPAPDLERIYAGAAANPDRNPVILVPGFAGSNLVLENGRKVWGAWFTDDSLGTGGRDGFRAFALDVDRLEGPIDFETVARLDDDARTDGILERAEAGALVTEFEVDVYSALVELLEVAGYADPAAAGSDPVAPPYFKFAYDWRQDNAANAVELGRFIDEAARRGRERRRAAGRPEGEIRFDVITHSMGALVARYYLRYGGRDVLSEVEPVVTWEGARTIDRLFLVAPPNLGSMKVLRDLVHGRPHPVLADFQATMLATLVGLYQMLPREEHDLWVDENGQPARLTFLDAAEWRARKWGPFAPDQSRYLEWLFPDLPDPVTRDRRMQEFMEAAFERARRFAAAVDRPADTPCPASVILFAGDADPTLARGMVSSDGGAPRPVFEKPENRDLLEPGDGTVTRASALADGRSRDNRASFLASPVPWTGTVFISDRHNSIMGNPTLQNHLLHLLLELPPRTGALAR
jgi:hypothetical protein